MSNRFSDLNSKKLVPGSIKEPSIADYKTISDFQSSHVNQHKLEYDEEYHKENSAITFLQLICFPFLWFFSKILPTDRFPEIAFLIIAVIFFFV